MLNALIPRSLAILILAASWAMPVDCFAADADPIEPGSWSLAILPEAEYDPRDDVLHLGDVVYHNTAEQEDRTAKFFLAPQDGRNYVACEDAYPGHLQGITTNGSDVIYWSFTTKLVKTDAAGKLLKAVDAIDHHGDLTFAGGKVYVAVNDLASSPPGQFNYPNPQNPKRQWIYEYDADLQYVARHAAPQAIYGAGGVAHHNDRFWVVGGLPGPWEGGFDPANYDKNYVYEYDSSFNFVKAHELATGNTDRGIQTAEFGGGKWWFGTYETNPRRAVGERQQDWRRQVYAFNDRLTDFTRFGFNAVQQPPVPYPDGALGIAALPNGYFLVAGDKRSRGAYRGYVWMAEVNQEGRLLILDAIPDSVGVLSDPGKAAVCTDLGGHFTRFHVDQ